MSKYAVTTDTTIVALTNSEHGAVEYAVKINPHAKYIPFTTENDILNDQEYGPGYYITTDVRTAKLLEKYKITIPGFLFNGVGHEIRVVKEWRIIAFNDEILTKFTNETNDNGKKEIKNTLQKSTDLYKKRPIESNQQSTSSNHKQQLTAFNHKQQPTESIQRPTESKQITTKISQVTVSSSKLNNNSSSEIPKNVVVDYPGYVCKNVLDIGNSLDRNAQHNVIVNYIKSGLFYKNIDEEDIIIFTDSDNTSSKWTKQFPKSFVYGQPNEEMLYYLTAQICNTDSLDKLFRYVVFDNCLVNKYVNNIQFKNLFKNLKRNNIGIIVMTDNNEIINNSDISNVLNMVFLRSMTVGWMRHVSENFIKTYPKLETQQNLEKLLSYSNSIKGFLVIQAKTGEIETALYNKTLIDLKM